MCSVMVLSSIVVLVLFGAFGGLVRALYGVLKAVSAGRSVNVWYFLVTLVSSGVIGGIAGLLFDVDIRVVVLAGYVGSDALESLVSLVLPKSFVVRKKV